VDSFNRAAIDLALDPIGVKLPKTMELGRTAIDYANKKLGEAYDRLLPNTVFRADPVFNTELSNLRTLVTELPKDQARQFEAIFENRVQKRLDPNGVMLGDTMKQVESELGKISRDYGSSADAAQRQLGSAVDEIRNLLRQNLQRNNPDQAAELEAINSAYARFVRVQAASSRRANTGGVFTPNDLSNAVRQTDTSVRKGRYARGNALMQDLSDPASAVLPQKVPDSGTAGRLAAMSALGLGAESGALSPYQIAAALGLAAPYTEMGSNVLNQWARAAPASRAVVRGGLETAAPYVSAPAGVVGGEVAENAGRRR
jgi:hypothetical protein